MLKINQILIKPPHVETSFRGTTPQTSATTEKEASENTIQPNISQPIGINTPIEYKYSGQLNILGDLTAQTYRLANGQKIIILPKKGPTVIKTYVNAGSMNEPDELRGISHYIEHNLFNGTNNLKAGEFFKRVNSLGASTNASTSFSTTDFYISSQLLKKGDLEEKIKLHSDMLQNPVFAPDMLDKERGPVISEISMVMDEPENTAINLAIKNLYQIKTKSPDLIAGTIENIKNVTREDVVAYYNTHYTPDNFTTIISGDVDPKEVMRYISKYFTKKNPTKPMVKKYEELNPIETSIRVEKKSDKATASTTVLAFAGPENNNTKDKLITEVLTTILTGHKNARFNKAFEKLYINVDAGIEKIGNKQNDQKAVLFITSCTPDKTDEAIKTMYKELFDIQNGKLSQKELETAKKHLRTSIQEVSENSYLLNNLIGSAYLDGDMDYLGEYENILNQITVQDIQTVAKKYFNLNKASIATVSPSEKALKQDNSKVSFGNSNESELVKKEAYKIENIKNYRLHNNVEIVTSSGDSDISVFNLELGCQQPAAVKPAVAEILQIMLNRGSAHKDKENFFDEADTKGIEINFNATPEKITACAKSNYTETAAALQLAKEVLFSPRFSKADFDYAKEELKETITQQPKSAQANAIEELFKHIPYSASKETFLKSLDEVTLEDVKGLYAYIMKNSSAICTTTAPFKENPELLNVFTSELANNLPNFKPLKVEIFNSFIPASKNKIIAQADQRNQADVAKCYKFKTNSNMSDIAKFTLLNIILGGNPNSRLFNDLRERQKLAYRVRSNIDFIGNTGVMQLTIKTTTDNPLEGDDKISNLNKALDGFDANIERICKEYVSDEELESAKLYLKTKILDEAETSSGRVKLLAQNKNTFYGLNATNIFLEEIDNITKEDIMAAANYIFQNPSLTSIVASPKTLDYFKSHLK